MGSTGKKRVAPGTGSRMSGRGTRGHEARGRPSWAVFAFAAVLSVPWGCVEDSGSGAEALSDAPSSLVAEWNETAMTLGPSLGTHLAMRTLAMMHTAVYDAVVAFGGRYHPYHVTTSPPAGASPRAAAAAAAYHVLDAVYTAPDQHATIQARFDAQLAQVDEGPARDDGVAFGRSVAEAILVLRSTDGCMAAMEAECPDGTMPGAWRRTASGEPVAPGWGDLPAWTLTSGSQFDQGGPPQLTSREYADALDEVRELGAAGSMVRTHEQSHVATFWEEHVPAKWTALARHISAQEGLSLATSARLFALLSVTLADSAIAGWNMKYRYDFWRPETAIHLASADGNDQPAEAPTWESYLVAPAFPEYVSGHSVTCAAAAAVLGRYLGSDHYHFQLAGMHGGEPRTYESFTQAAEEAGQSRIYAGIHFRFSNEHGLQAGRTLGEYVYDNFFRPL